MQNSLYEFLKSIVPFETKTWFPQNVCSDVLDLNLDPIEVMGCALGNTCLQSFFKMKFLLMSKH